MVPTALKNAFCDPVNLMAKMGMLEAEKQAESLCPLSCRGLLQKEALRRVTPMQE